MVLPDLDEQTDHRKWTQQHLDAADLRVSAMAPTPPQGEADADCIDVNVRGPGRCCPPHSTALCGTCLSCSGECSGSPAWGQGFLFQLSVGSGTFLSIICGDVCLKHMYIYSFSWVVGGLGPSLWHLAMPILTELPLVPPQMASHPS